MVLDVKVMFQDSQSGRRILVKEKGWPLPNLQQNEFVVNSSVFSLPEPKIANGGTYTLNVGHDHLVPTVNLFVYTLAGMLILLNLSIYLTDEIKSIYHMCI